MADDVPDVAAEYAGMDLGSGSGSQGSNDGVPYGPPNPFEASPDQPGAYGPPKDVFTGSSSGSGSSSAGGGLDLSSLVKSAGDAAGTVIKNLGNLATPPTPKIPTPPTAPNLPSSLPLPPSPPAPPAPVAPTASNQPAANVGPVSPRLSRGAKIAIGVGIGGVVVGGGLLIASAVGEKKKR